MSTENTQKPVRVIVGVDGSAQSRQALVGAAQIAKAAGAQLEAVAAWDVPSTTGWAAWPQDWDPGRDTAKTLTSTVDDVFGAERPKNLQLTVRQGGAVQILLQESQGALMLIVGSRGHGGFAGMLLGSVSAKVAEYASCPVLVVHGETMPPSVISAAGS